MRPSLQKFLTALVDYAGLFPPAALPMREAVENYAQYRSGPFSWMLGRFLLPASRLREFEGALQEVTSRPDQSSSLWPVHLILSHGADFEELRSTIQNFMSATEISHKNYEIKAVELPSLEPKTLRMAIALIPPNLDVFCEFSWETDIKAYLAVIKAEERFAKVRTGGVTPNAFPRSSDLAQFLLSAAQHQVPFKATAGLHYLLPAWHSLPSPHGPTRARMQGFLNVAIAAAIAYHIPITPKKLETILEQDSLKAFHFDVHDLDVRSPRQSGEPFYKLSLTNLVESRTHFFRGFGSCSFELPVTELQEAQLC